MIPGKRFDPATETSRRPTPERFAHLRDWVAPVIRDIKITNITEMTNINEQLEQSGNLYVSNIISRVIAQLIGKYGDGFVTIEATSDGKLKVDTTLNAGATIGLEAGTNLIGKVEEQLANPVKRAKISFTAAADNTIVAAVTGKKIQVRSYAFTVAAEVNLTWKSGSTAISGAMDFGGTDEPRGISRYLGKYPIETVAGEALVLTNVGAGQVSGDLTYTEE